ncbi:MAG TPA: condensation domain-containing protein, partial [Hydrogenophaga sp.]|uniref:condensation domain-containing protein n=1 Tax=Hydrogenophaga sp. TaxID=1904254 RepID=UPI002C865BA8
MNARELLHRLEGLGVDLEVAEGRLRVSASRGRLDDELKTAIAGHKTELMALLAERGGVAHAPHASPAGKADTAPRATVAHDGLLPLSLFQERLWILQQLEPESTTYLLALAWPVSGEVPREQLLAAVQRVHARHLGLRVHFVQEGDVPGARRVDVPPVTVHDLRHLPASERLGAVQAARERAVHTPIDLSRQTPLRFELLDFAPEGYALIAAAHHIAVDAWSLQILLRELAQELKAPAPESPTRLQYADYAAWQREHQHPEAIRAELDWWDEALKGAPQTSMFPPDLPASDAPARGATVDFEFDAAFSAALKRWVHERHATVYMAFLAASA